MVTAFGVGEAAISVSGAPGRSGPLQHTVRDVGPVTRGPVRAPGSATSSACGGRSAPTGRLASLDRTGDVVVVAGRDRAGPAARCRIDELVAGHRAGGAASVVIVGARQPDQIIFSEDLAGMGAGRGPVAVTVDVGARRVGRACGPGDLLAGRGRVRPGRTSCPDVRSRDHDAVHRPGPGRPGVDPARIRVSLEREHAVRGGLVRPLPARAVSAVPRRSGRALRRRRLDERCSSSGAMSDPAPARPRPTLAVWKFASCDGCQLSLLDCEDELLGPGRCRAHRPFHRDVAGDR